MNVFDRLLITTTGAFFIYSCVPQANVEKKNVPLTGKADSVSYAVGVNYGEYLRNNHVLDSLDINPFFKGLEQAYKQDSLLLDKEIITRLINEYVQELKFREYARIVNEGDLFLKENSQKEGVVTLESGLQYKILKVGAGEKPQIINKVKLHFKGMNIYGTVFDSSYDRGQPDEFTLINVIKGWQEALQLMPEGSHWIIYIPYELAYEEKGFQNIVRPYETLVFEIELLEIVYTK